MQQEKKKTVNWGLLVRIFALALPYKNKFFTAVFLTVGISILGPYRPYLIQIIIDKYIAVGDGPGLLNMSLFLLFILGISALMQWWGTLLSTQ
jgi:ATP-binding cassette subfamily B protein